jgi:hypothetical protein
MARSLGASAPRLHRRAAFRRSGRTGEPGETVDGEDGVAHLQSGGNGTCSDRRIWRILKSAKVSASRVWPTLTSHHAVDTFLNPGASGDFGPAGLRHGLLEREPGAVAGTGEAGGLGGTAHPEVGEGQRFRRPGQLGAEGGSTASAWARAASRRRRARGRILEGIVHEGTAGRNGKEEAAGGGFGGRRELASRRNRRCRRVGRGRAEGYHGREGRRMHQRNGI